MKAHGLVLVTLAGLALVAATQARADIICSDATGDLKYEQTGYNRGMAPRPGDRISYEKWSFKGAVLGEFSQFSAAPSRPPQMPFQVQTSERQNLLSEPYLCGGSYQCGEVVHYSMKLEIHRLPAPVAVELRPGPGPGPGHWPFPHPPQSPRPTPTATATSTPSPSPSPLADYSAYMVCRFTQINYP